MVYNFAIKTFLIFVVFFSFTFSNSYSLTESVDLFGELNSADIILNDIWIEPQNPINGEAISVHGSVYNAGIVPTEEVSDVVTVGYIVNGELVEFIILENILPGIENGVEISSGPIFDAIKGDYLVTVIINYHDTLSHLRDNQENNIVQKIFQIGTESPTMIDSNLYQKYNERTKNQEVTMIGQVTNIFQERVKEKEVIINLENKKQIETTTDQEGNFSVEFDIPHTNKPIEITTEIKEKNFLPGFSQFIFPIKLNDKQSAIALELISESENNMFDYSTLTMVLFQDSYDNLFNKISPDDNQKDKIDNFLVSAVPGNHEYIVEIYINGKILDAFQVNLEANEIVKKETYLSESAQIQFKITDEKGEPISGVLVENWIYTAISNEEGLTEWVDVLPTISENDPYVAKAVFPDGTIVWSDSFLVAPDEGKVVQIIKGGRN